MGVGAKLPIPSRKQKLDYALKLRFVIAKGSCLKPYFGICVLIGEKEYELAGI